ncbi:MAG TPA: histidinol-phosphate transaminase [Tepidisphaeraceae bacterium]|nr:histidinol-phosphate transaminase [Tepidisphaeraceae bacterium]
MAPKFVRTIVRQMTGYVPGKQPASGQRVVKLNTNENPFPPSPRVMQAIAQIEPELLRRYPDPMSRTFCESAGRLHKVSPECILTGNGSDDILAIAMLTFLSPADTVAMPDPTYSLYPVIAELDEVKVALVPWEKDWSLPTKALLATKPKAIFLANPNAPSATFVSPQALDELAGNFDGLLLIDEAYVDFADDNCIPLIKEHENVVVTRTLSKAYSLAGLRFGYAIAQPQVVREMNKAKDSYPCDAISIVAATAAIEDQEYARQTWEHVRGERTRISAELSQLGWSVLPSHANFLLASPPDGDAKQVFEGLEAQGILVRYFNSPGLSDKIRITLVTSQENNALLGGIKALTATEKAA